MQCYTDLIPPTAVTCAAALSFLGPKCSNLVVAKVSLLQVFDVVSSGPSNGGETAPHRQLMLVGEYSLSGTVTGIARVKTLDTKTGGEALLLAFKDAKLSLVEWDPENHRISTISIHYYEGTNVTPQPFGPDLSECESILAVDPDSRCAALKFGARHLAILPFRQSGDDLIGDEEDAEHMDTMVASLKRQESTQQNGNGDAEQAPYRASFVLPLTALDPALAHTVHLAFLYEYREPTFGVLASLVAPSSALIAERKDTLTYTVFTLDIEQRASTNLISVSKLPSSLWKVVPLPLPIGGALLVGTNEFIHIDQSGKANATAVNEFARMESGLGMVDQSHLNMRLENCVVDLLDPDTGHLMVILSDATMATLTFEKVGRSISALHVARVSPSNGGSIISAAPSCIVTLEQQSMFVGSEDGPSILLGWPKPNQALNRKRSHAQMLDKSGTDMDEDEEEEEEDDDDLYDAAPEAKRRAVSIVPLDPSTITYSTQDRLPSLAPTNSVCFGRSSSGKEDKLQLLASVGRGKASTLSFISRDIVPEVTQETRFPAGKQAWAVARRDSNAPESLQPSYHDLLFVSSGELLKIYDIGASNEGDLTYTERAAPEFELEGETIYIGTILDDTQIVQCRRSEIRTYDSNLALSQIIPMIDEETDADLNITAVSICDPYLLVIRDDSSVQVLQVKGKELETLEGEGPVQEKTWLSGCLYADKLTNDEPALFLLNGEGNLTAFSLPDLQPVYKLPGMSYLPPVVSHDAHHRRTGAKETLSELLLADLGHDHLTKPYLILRTALDDIILYEPFHFPQSTESDSWYSDLRFRKVPAAYPLKFVDTEPEDQRPHPMRAVRISGYSAVYVPGVQQSLILKESVSLPRMLTIRNDAENSRMPSLTPLRCASCPDGFAILFPGGDFHRCRLPSNTTYSTGCGVRQIQLDHISHEIRQLAYFEPRGVYVVATCRDVDFLFSDEDTRHPDQDDITLRPQIPQYSIHLVSATSHRILDSFQVPYYETITSLKVMQLEVSENTHAQRNLIVVGAAAQRGEDMPSKGTVMVFDVIDVVPEPDVSESDFKLQMLAREETKGAVTALDVFAGGLIGTVQGQKVMIRGLKEDGSCLPVAFLDAVCHIHTLKTLGSTGMWLAGDAWKGLWFGGFTEEPYKLTPLGKSRTHMEIVTAEFLPFDGNLFLLAIDANTDLHVLQYDPENPKSVSGMRLLHRSTFHIGHFPTSMSLLPSTLASFTAQQQQHPDSHPNPLFHVLTTSLSGATSLLTPLDESTYRRLSALQTHLATILEHPAALNPRAYRAIESEGFGARGLVDGSLVARICELNSVRRADVLARAGADVWALKSDLEIIGGGGLGFL